MNKIFNLPEIEAALKNLDIVTPIEQGFVLYSQGMVVVPPVGELLFPDAPGDAHIKYGFIKDADYFVIKIATGFYNNVELGISSSNGLMLVFSQKTGELGAILLDQGILTNHRTAAAGAIAAKNLMPEKIEGIGILGAGIQGKLQLLYLQKVTACKKVTLWGMNQTELSAFVAEMEPLGYNITTTLEPARVAAECNLIVTATPSTRPLLKLADIRPGTHITALGSDTSEKIELDPAIIHSADLVVVDSLSQSRSRGEVYRASISDPQRPLNPLELGDVIAGKHPGRKSDEEITIADLTGVAVQDIIIATEILKVLNK